jgi:hypothetical protein
MGNKWETETEYEKGCMFLRRQYNLDPKRLTNRPSPVKTVNTVSGCSFSSLNAATISIMRFPPKALSDFGLLSLMVPMRLSLERVRIMSVYFWVAILTVV